MSTLAPSCSNDVRLGLPQYPVSPGVGPRRGLPFGQRGTGPDATLRGGNVPFVPEKSFLPLLAVTELPETCFVPSRAVNPCTVMVSPSGNESALQPFLLKTIALSNSTAQRAGRG